MAKGSYKAIMFDYRPGINNDVFLYSGQRINDGSGAYLSCAGYSG